MSVYACSCVRVRGWERIAWRCGCSRRHGPDGSRSASPAKVLSRQEARGDADVRTELGDPPEHVSYVCAVPHAMAGRVAQLVAYACMMWLSEWCGMELLAVLQVWRTCVQNQVLHNILLLSMYVHGGVGGATGPLLTCQNATPAYLIVAARKKVRVHKWNGSAMKFEHYKDHVTTDEALSLVWTGDNTVIVGFKNEYTVLNIETGDTRRVFETRHTLAAANFVPRCVAWPAVLHGCSIPRSHVGLHRRRTTLIGELHSNHRSRSASRASGSHRMLTTSGASGGSAVDDEEIPSVEALLVKGSKNGAQGAVRGGCGLGAHGGVLTPAHGMSAAGIFVGPNGRPTRTIGYCIQWPSTPSTLVSSRDFPYARMCPCLVLAKARGLTCAPMAWPAATSCPHTLELSRSTTSSP